MIITELWWKADISQSNEAPHTEFEIILLLVFCSLVAWIFKYSSNDFWESNAMYIAKGLKIEEFLMELLFFLKCITMQLTTPI